MQKNAQAGVGLVEVIVALVLLSLGVLGMIALQLNAISATDEAGARVQAMTIAQDLTERVRANPNQLQTYADQLNAASQDYTATTINSCVGSTKKVEPSAMAKCDVAQVVAVAKRYGMSIKMPVCSGVSYTRYCIYLAWDETKPEDSTDEKACTNSGIYNVKSSCLVFESY